jgi:hypothetical protein
VAVSDPCVKLDQRRARLFSSLERVNFDFTSYSFIAYLETSLWPPVITVLAVARKVDKMASREPKKSTQTSREELDAISNRVAIALAKREKLIKSWTASSTREKEPEKTQEELDVEDAALYRSQPPYLGVGATIPSHFLVSDADRNNRSLRAKFFPAKGLKASKQRDAEEKAASAKRGLQQEDSDEEGGRSSLGKAKKRKLAEVSDLVNDIEDVGKKPSEQDPERTVISVGLSSLLTCLVSC